MLLEKTTRVGPSAGRGLSDDRIAQRMLEMLPEEDRELLVMWAQGLASVRALGRLLGKHSGTISRRIRQLRARLNDPIAQTVVRFADELPFRHREIALRVLCRGERIGQAGSALGMSRQQAIRTLAEVRGWAKLRYQHLEGRTEP